MAERKPIAWITRGGKHIPIFEDEQISKDSDTKEKQIEKNEEEGKQKSYIERNDDGEILFKASVKDLDTGKIKTSFEFSAYDLAQAKNDLHKNGYNIHSNSLLPKKLYEQVMQETNGNKWDWEDAQKQFKEELKREKKGKQ